MINAHDLTPGIRWIRRDPLFERTRAELRAQGGYAAVAADKAEDFISILTGAAADGDRSRFRFTRNGEHRIRNCRKVDLGCGYRIVCIQKARRLMLLYIGTHDDCFRWIERNRTAEYDLESMGADEWEPVQRACADRTVNDEDDLCESDRLSEAFEASLTERLDDAVLRQVFPGLVGRRRGAG